MRAVLWVDGPDGGFIHKHYLLPFCLRNAHVFLAHLGKLMYFFACSLLVMHNSLEMNTQTHVFLEYPTARIISQ